MLTSKCVRCGIYVLIAIVLVDNVTSQNVKRSSTIRQVMKRNDGINRARRAPYISSYSSHSSQGVHYRVKQPGFFWLLKSLFVEQLQDTKNTYNQIRGLVNQNQPSSTTEKHIHDDHDDHHDDHHDSTTHEPHTTTTMMPMQDLRKVLLRNLRGLVNLYNKELEIALRQSEFTRNDFNKELKYSIAHELH